MPLPTLLPVPFLAHPLGMYCISGNSHRSLAAALQEPEALLTRLQGGLTPGLCVHCFHYAALGKVIIFYASLVTNCCRQEQFKLLLNLYQAWKGNDSEKHLHVCFSHCVQKHRTFLLYITTHFKAWSVINISS